MKVSTILDYIDGGHMALPEFQRGYVWNRDQVRGLMGSLYRRHPVGSLLVWGTEAKEADHLPEVGLELEDEIGSVVLENVELAWEQEKIGVVLNKHDLELAIASETEWTFILENQKDLIEQKLEEIFDINPGSEVLS
jgi:hypothetical protein